MNPERVARVDLSHLTDREAREVLDEYAPIVHREAARVAWVPMSGLDVDDLKAIGRLAVLEAHETYRTDRGCSIKTWVQRIVRQRIRESAQRESRAVEPPRRETTTTGSPEERYLAREACRTIEARITTLSPRQQTILACRLRGETYASIAASLGVDTSLVHRQHHAALALLRLALAAE